MRLPKPELTMRIAPITYAIMLIAPAIGVGQSLPIPSTKAEPLDPYVFCQYSAGFFAASTDRLPGQGVRYRAVATANGERKVSIVDGYRVMISQGEPSYFANMKIEKSDASQYSRDKDAVIKNLEFAMEQSSTGKASWEHMPYNGFDVYGVTDPTMDENGPNGIYALFRDSTQTIVTIYFLGQRPLYRKFKTIEEHDALRDLMLEELTTCANSPALLPPANVPYLRTGDDFNAFINGYYLHPQREGIAYAIAMLSRSGVLQIPQAIGQMTAFFSEVFAANPERLAEWQPIIDKQPQTTTLALGQALSWSKAGGVLGLEGRSTEMNDLYWGAFFASGNPAYVKKLLDLVPLAQDRNDLDLWKTGSSAKWSLAANARRHPRVRSILEGEKRSADKFTHDLIDELLKRDPGDIQREIMETYARQKAAGKWK